MLSKYQLCPSYAPCVCIIYLLIESIDQTILADELLYYGSVFASQEINYSKFSEFKVKNKTRYYCMTQ